MSADNGSRIDVPATISGFKPASDNSAVERRYAPTPSGATSQMLANLFFAMVVAEPGPRLAARDVLAPGS